MTTTERIEVTITSRVLAEFQVEDAGGTSPDDKGCLTLIIKTTEDTEIDICFDGHYRQPLTELGEAVTKAGGIKATGTLDLTPERHTGELECYHHMEADTGEPWSPGEAK